MFSIYFRSAIYLLNADRVTSQSMNGETIPSDGSNALLSVVTSTSNCNELLSKCNFLNHWQYHSPLQKFDSSARLLRSANSAAVERFLKTPDEENSAMMMMMMMVVVVVVYWNMTVCRCCSIVDYSAAQRIEELYDSSAVVVIWLGLTLTSFYWPSFSPFPASSATTSRRSSFIFLSRQS